jgi:hypothetical protein
MKTKLSIIVILALLSIMACNGKPTTQPPSQPIVISTPVDGSILHDPVIISVSLGESLVFTRVDFYIDSLLAVSDSLFPFSFTWDFFNLASGSSHIIQAIGYTSDSSYVSSIVHVTIQFTRGFTFASTYRPNSQHALGVSIYGNVLFVSTGDAGLEVLDVTNKALPLFRSRFTTTGQVVHSAVQFPYVYMAERDQGVEMANFQNVDSLISVHHFSSQSQVVDIAALPDIVFAAERDGLSILASLNISVHSRRGFQDLLTGVVARSDTAFVVGANAFYVVDASNPDVSQIVGLYSNLGQSQDVAVVDTFAFIANGSQGIIALSISDPANPRFLARFNPGQIITSVAVGAGVLFAGTNSSVAYALDYNTPGVLTVIQSTNVSNAVTDLAFGSNYLYVANSNGVDIFKFIP